MIKMHVQKKNIIFSDEKDFDHFDHFDKLFSVMFTLYYNKPDMGRYFIIFSYRNSRAWIHVTRAQYYVVQYYALKLRQSHLQIDLR
jgi:hypothetical protein